MLTGKQRKRNGAQLYTPTLPFARLHRIIGTKYAHAQPYRDPNVSHHEIPMWQKDMAGWCNKRMIFVSCEFKDFQPRKGFTCSKYFEDETLLQ